jgi:hypothetical protein
MYLGRTLNKIFGLHLDVVRRVVDLLGHGLLQVDKKLEKIKNNSKHILSKNYMILCITIIDISFTFRSFNLNV